MFYLLVYGKIIVQRCDLTLLCRLYVSIQKLLYDYSLGLLKANTSGRRNRFRRGRASSAGEAGEARCGRAPGGLAAALGAAAMGKKHKKHKTEWRSSYEGEAAARFVTTGGRSRRRGPGLEGGDAVLGRQHCCRRSLEKSVEHPCSSAVFPEVSPRSEGNEWLLTDLLFARGS